MSSVNLTKRVITDKGPRFVPVVYSAKNGRIKPDYVKIDGKEQHHPEGVYYLDYYVNGVRKRETAGADASRADQLKGNKETELEAIRIGLVPSAGLIPATRKATGPTIADAIKKYMDRVQVNRKPNTVRLYAKSLQYFEESLAPGVTLLSEITKEDMHRYHKYLIALNHSPHTCFSRFLSVMVFLKSLGLTMTHDPATGRIVKLLSQDDWPAFTPKEVEIYEPEDAELPILFNASTPEERLMWRFFLMTGERVQEALYSTMDDVNFGDRPTVRVSAKWEHKWSPKVYKGRTIPVAPKLIECLRELRQVRNPKQLLFPKPGELNKPRAKGDFLRLLKSCARRAGLNCGFCEGCLRFKECEKWYIHKFRATFATLSLEAGNSLSTVQAWLGHTDLKATQRYLRASRDQATRDRVNVTFDRMGL